MNNATIKLLRERVERDDLLTKEDQIRVLTDLLRANRRIQAAKQAGFLAHEQKTAGSAKPNGSGLAR
ncbi:hypothetical protein [Enterovirga rhinocerotis]|uniref:Transposase n=1 Tax=Enterovirga rhinocerotis TaxID=1339210 RepID=A0A4R7BXE7_9HYPH|nr:hypothetical protein [Enterovirga rhinocerotis]TDR90183.1 hypothetical protein EV668_3025 [Enterovirga rhinocerotis]